MTMDLLREGRRGDPKAPMAATGLMAQAPQQWHQAQLRLLGQSAPGLAERIAMQATPRLTEISSRRLVLAKQQNSLETSISSLLERAKEAKDEEESRSILSSLSLHRTELSRV